jgi:uncharacterized protein YecE (DUF72 family)
MGELLIGTSGYDYPEWKNVFYPAVLRRDEYLAYYAGQFNALELNFSYYTIPTAKQLREMYGKTNGKIKFSIKGHQSFTHCIEIGKWKGAVKEFRTAIEPLIAGKVLSSVLLQFPQSFHYETETRQYLAALIAEFGGTPLAVEFRHNSWQTPQVYKGLQERDTALCVCDLPGISRLPAFNPLVTSSVAYMRFHGKNAGNWYGTNARDRYDYAYTGAELAAFKPKLLQMQASSKQLQIFFNNHAKGSAALNARKLMTIMAE